MKTRLPLNILASAAVVCCAVSSSQAAVVISNYAGANDRSGTAFFTQQVVKAAGFTMGTGMNYRLDSVDLRLWANTAGSLLPLGLYADVSGAPGGSALVSFVAPTLAGGSLVVDANYVATTDFILQGSVTYWLVAGGAGTTPDVAWTGSSPGITPTGVATSVGYLVLNGIVGGISSPSNVQNTYRINGTAVAVPEPDALALVGIALAAAGFSRRWVRAS